MLCYTLDHCNAILAMLQEGYFLISVREECLYYRRISKAGDQLEVFIIIEH